MQNDLISRKDAIDILCKLHIDNVAVNDKRVTEYIRELPTAYNVEKVIEEVDEFEIRCCDCQESCNTEGCLVERIKNVIRKGGKE